MDIVLPQYEACKYHRTTAKLLDCKAGPNKYIFLFYTRGSTIDFSMAAHQLEQVVPSLCHNWGITSTQMLPCQLKGKVLDLLLYEGMPVGFGAKSARSKEYGEPRESSQALPAASRKASTSSRGGYYPGRRLENGAPVFVPASLVKDHDLESLTKELSSARKTGVIVRNASLYVSSTTLFLIDNYGIVQKVRGIRES